MSLVSLNGIMSPRRANNYIIGSSGPSYLDDLVIQYLCKDGISGYPTLTDSEGNGNATIYSAGAGITYPGGQVFPYFDGINDYADAGNVSEANITDNLAVCAWIRDRNYGSGVGYIAKWNSAGHRQWMLYKYSSYYRLIVSESGSNYSLVQTIFTGPMLPPGWPNVDLFFCGVYQYKTNGTSEMRLFMNIPNLSVLSEVDSISNAVGPLHTSPTAPMSIGSYYNGSIFTGFAQFDLKKAEVYNVDASRIDAWIDGTNPQLLFAAGSGQ